MTTDRMFIALALFDSPLHKVRDGALRILQPTYRATPCEIFPLPNQEYIGAALKATVWSPAIAPGRTAFMGHVPDGWYTLTNLIAKGLKVDTLALRATSPGADRYVCSFTFWTGGIETRTVHALDDSPWRFFQRGVPISGEDASRYGKRRIADRLTATYLAELATSRGWPVSSPAFWKSDEQAILIANGDA